MIALLLFTIFLTLFLLVEALNVAILKEPSIWLAQAGAFAGFAGFSLLVVDVALPVPSSLVMIAHGALFGVALGTLISLVGSTCAVLVGFAIGRRGGRLLTQLVMIEELELAERLLTRWGVLAIIVTRPVPLLAETTAIVVGTSRLGWGRTTLAALAGSLPGALIYALAGARAVSFQNGAVVFGLVLLVAGSFWLVGRRLAPHLAQPESGCT